MSTFAPTTPQEESTLHIFGIVSIVALFTLVCGIFSLNYAQASMDKAQALKEKRIQQEWEDRKEKLKQEIEEEGNALENQIQIETQKQNEKTNQVSGSKDNKNVRFRIISKV